MNAALASSCSFSSTSDLHFRHHLYGHFHLRKCHNPCRNSVKIPMKLPVLACAAAGSGGGEKVPERRTFLSLEEAGLVEMSGLDTHERFLCRLTISSLNLLKVISEQEGCSIEELNAGRVCDWFLKDKLKKEQNLGTAVLQWEDPGFQL